MGQINHINMVISHSSLLNRSFIPNSTSSLSVLTSSSPPSILPGTCNVPTLIVPDFSPDVFSLLRSSSSSSELSFFPFFFAALSISAAYSLCLERV